MRRKIIRILAFFKGIVIVLKPHVLFGWLRLPFLKASNTLSLTKWVAEQEKTNVFNDFYTPSRDHSKRTQLYQFVFDKLNLKDEAIDYLEFGVYNGNSFKWWVNKCGNSKCRFFGFDTFQGLPENWGSYKKGEMSSNIPIIDDLRVEFVQGLFQETLNDFILRVNLKGDKRKIIHCDADLFTSTLFVLTSLAPYIKRGDILFFDEFNVPNHEFFAFRIFTESFYIKTKLLGAVNNYYQVALIIE